MPANCYLACLSRREYNGSQLKYFTDFWQFEYFDSWYMIHMSIDEGLQSINVFSYKKVSYWHFWVFDGENVTCTFDGLNNLMFSEDLFLVKNKNFKWMILQQPINPHIDRVSTFLPLPKRNVEYLNEKMWHADLMDVTVVWIIWCSEKIFFGEGEKTKSIYIWIIYQQSLKLIRLKISWYSYIWREPIAVNVSADKKKGEFCISFNCKIFPVSLPFSSAKFIFMALHNARSESTLPQVGHKK